MNDFADANLGSPKTAPIKVRKLIFREEHKENEDEDWICVTLGSKFYRTNVKLCNFLSYYSTKKWHEAWFLLCFLVTFGFSVHRFMQHKDKSNHIEFYMYLGLSIALGLNSILQILSVYIFNDEKPWPEWLIFPSTCLHGCILGLSIYIFANLKIENDDMAWGFFPSAFLSTIVYSSFFIAWLIFIALIIAIGIMELIIRIIICKVDCPSQEDEEKVVRYGIYEYNSSRMFASPSCTICLIDFKRRSKDICILDCGKDHIFHERCIVEWAYKQQNCPICRGPLKFKYT